METLILICLLIVIGLLLHDKITTKPKRSSGKLPPEEPANPNLPDIMGQPRSTPVQSHPEPKKAPERQTGEPEETGDTFEPETGDDLGSDKEIPQEELDEVFGETPDFEEEEEELRRYGVPNGEDGLATGVTFQELATAGALLRQEMLGPSQQEEAVNIVRKIQGTELFALLENSIENASQKIAGLLDRSLPTEADSGSSTMRNDDDFDIREFV